MRNRVICLIFLTGMLSLLAGCEPISDGGGRKVKFTATSKGSVATKTSYTGENGGYAIIGWGSNDMIRIYSPNTNYLTGQDGAAHEIGETGAGQTTVNYVYDDYYLTNITTDGHESKANLSNTLGENEDETTASPDGRGLYWNASSGNATFYGVYPKNTGINWFNNGGLAFTLVIPNPNNQTISLTDGVHSPDISSLPLLAMQQNVTSGTKVDLKFYPAFTAFEFNLKSKEGEITLNSFKLSTENDSDHCYMTGTCIYAPGLWSGDPESENPKLFYIENSQIYFIDESNKAYWDGYEECEKSLTVRFPSGTKIDTNKGVTFTLFALPNDLDKVSITLDLTADGVNKVRTLKLQQKDSNNEFQWLTFPAGHKARFKAIAVDKGATWRIFYDVSVNEWVPLDPTQVII